MKAYHGTTPARAAAIVEDGIKPRTETGYSNWGAKDMQSIPDHVYLSVPFAPHYALAASETTEIGLVEVELEELTDARLHPDEDFIEQAFRADELTIEHSGGILDGTGDIADRTAEIRDHIKLFQPYWELSLDVLGNISHHGAIPSEAITRATVVDLPRELRVHIDPVIEIRAVQITRSKYETFTELLIGGEVTIEEYVTAAMGVPVPNSASPGDVVSEEDIDAMRETLRADVEDVIAQDFIRELC